MKKVVIISLLCSISFAITNSTLSKTFSKFRGDEYNLLVAPSYISKGGKRTKRAIMEGFFDAIDEVKGIVKRNNINALLKEFPGPDEKEESVSNISPSYIHYFQIDKQMYELLKELIKTLSENDRTISTTIKKDKSMNSESNSLDTGDNLDDFQDISEQTITTSDGQISTEEIFINQIRKLSKNYLPNEDINSINLSDLSHPFIIGNSYEWKKINGLFGIAFYPQKRGSLKVLGMDIILIHINSELKDRANVIIRNIKPFSWHRNSALIAGRINKTLKQIISQALGVNISK